MWAVYYVSVTTVGTFVTDWTNDTFVGAIQGWAGDALAAAGASDLIVSLVVDGISAVLVPFLVSFRRWLSCSSSFPFWKIVVHGTYRIRYGPCIPSLRIVR